MSLAARLFGAITFPIFGISLFACGSHNADTQTPPPVLLSPPTATEGADSRCDPVTWTDHLDSASIVPIVDGGCDFDNVVDGTRANALPLSCKGSPNASCNCAPIAELEEVQNKAWMAALTKSENGRLHLKDLGSRWLLDNVNHQMKEPCFREGVPAEAVIFRFTLAGGFPNRCGWQLSARAEKRGQDQSIVIKQRQFDPEARDCRCSMAVKSLDEAQWGELERLAAAADLANAKWEHSEFSFVKDGSFWGFEMSKDGLNNAAYRISPSANNGDRAFEALGRYFMNLANICAQE